MPCRDKILGIAKRYGKQTLRDDRFYILPVQIVSVVNATFRVPMRFLAQNVLTDVFLKLLVRHNVFYRK